MAESIIKYSDLIGSDDTFDVIFENIEQLKKELDKLTKQTEKGLQLLNPNDEKALEKYIAQVDKLTKAKAKLEKEEKVAIQTKKKLNQLTDEELVQREKEKIAARERVQLAKQQAILRNSEKGSIEALRAQLSLVTLQWKRLSAEERENGQTGKDLVKQKLALTNQLKRLEKQTGDTRRNVGNYTDSLSKLGKVAVGVFLGRNLVSAIGRVGAAFSDLIEKNKDTDESIGGLSEALGQFGKSAGGVGLTILKFVAKPLTLLLNGVKAVLDIFAKPQPLEDFKATSDELTATTQKLNEEFKKEVAQSERLFTSLKSTNTGTEERKNLIKAINEQYGQYLPSLLTERSTLQEIEKAQNLVNVALSKNFALKIKQATQEDIFTNKVNTQIKAFESLSSKIQGVTANQLGDFVELTGKLEASEIEFFGEGIFDRNIDEIEGLSEGARQLFKDIQNASKGSEDIRREFKDAVSQTQKYNAAINQTQDAISGLEADLNSETKATSNNTKSVKDNTDAILSNNAARVKAIEEVQKQLLKVEAENIENARLQALRLQDLKFQEQQEAERENLDKLLKLQEQGEELVRQQFGKNSKELAAFRERAAQEREQAQKLTQAKLLELEKQYFKERENLQKEFEIKTIEIQSGGEKAQSDSRDEFFEKEKKRMEEVTKSLEKDAAEKEARAKEQEERTKKLLENISRVGNLIGDQIVKAFEKQAQQAEKLIEDQQKAIDTQRERAEQGLSNTLKFEQEQLAAREAERIRAEKRAAQAAKLLTLFNLVSAYAQNGDQNALARGLVDFAILEALEGALGGFSEGGYTGAGGKYEPKGIVHADEYVVNKEDTAKFGLKGKSGSEFGEAISDYWNSKTLLSPEHLQSQSQGLIVHTQNVDFSRLENEMRELRRAFMSIPRNEFDVDKVTDTMIEISKRVTNKKMTTNSKIKKRL